MEAALVCYTFLNLAILAFIILFVRASRARARPNERQDLEENALVSTDWERVRRERCLPSGCPRLRGQPPRPRKDLTCEICAATFLEVRLQQFLEGPLAPDAGDPISGTRIAEEGGRSTHPSRATASPALAVHGRPGEAKAGRAGAKIRPARRRRPLTRANRRWGRLRFGMGIGCAAAGAVLALFGGPPWLIVAGCLIVLLGLGLIASGAASGAL
jgi:hypothetical protein